MLCGVAYGGLDALHENGDEFVALLNQRLEFLGLAERFLFDDLEPDNCLPQLFEGDLELVNEIIDGLGTLSLAVVRSWRRS